MLDLMTDLATFIAAWKPWSDARDVMEEVEGKDAVPPPRINIVLLSIHSPQGQSYFRGARRTFAKMYLTCMYTMGGIRRPSHTEQLVFCTTTSERGRNMGGQFPGTRRISEDVVHIHDTFMGLERVNVAEQEGGARGDDAAVHKLGVQYDLTLHTHRMTPK